MIDDVGRVFGRVSGIHRNGHAAGAEDCEVELAPENRSLREHADAVTLFHAGMDQSAREALRRLEVLLESDVLPFARPFEPEADLVWAGFRAADVGFRNCLGLGELEHAESVTKFVGKPRNYAKQKFDTVPGSEKP